MTIRIIVIALHLLVAGLCAVGALATFPSFYEPAIITRVICAVSALAFGFEAYTMIQDGTPSK